MRVGCRALSMTYTRRGARAIGMADALEKDGAGQNGPAPRENGSEAMTAIAINSKGTEIENRRIPLVLAAVLVLWVSAFFFATSAYGATARASAGLSLEVREAAEVNVASDLVTVTVRLAPGVVAQVWFDSACSSSPAPGAVSIQKSGVHQFAMKTLDGSRVSGGQVCVASSDGQVKVSAPVVAANMGD